MSKVQTPKSPMTSKAEPVDKLALAKLPSTEEIKDEPRNRGSDGATKSITIDEPQLIEATRSLLRHHGIRKSAAAVRDAVGTTSNLCTRTSCKCSVAYGI